MSYDLSDVSRARVVVYNDGGAVLVQLPPDGAAEILSDTERLLCEGVVVAIKYLEHGWVDHMDNPVDPARFAGVMEVQRGC